MAVKQPLRDASALAAREVYQECLRAMDRYPAMNSAHEGYAVLKEEVDELWDEIKRQDADRSIDRMRVEAVQVGAMAVRFLGGVPLGIV